MAKLGINVDHVATLRQARGTSYPDPVKAAELSIALGVSCVTIHLREDRRHIQDSDLRRIRKLDGCRLNLEMAASEEIINLALEVKPEQVTIVPERREELTTEGGLEVAGRLEFFKEMVARFEEAGIIVSLFIDPDKKQIEASKDTGAEAIEINTGSYSDAVTDKEVKERLKEVVDGVVIARTLGLTVHAGHGLTMENVSPIASIKEIDELNIGHSIVSDGLFKGFSKAVTDMMELLEKC